MSTPDHIPVLLQEVTALLAPQPHEVVVDGTAGLGGHGLALARAMHLDDSTATGRLLGVDLDDESLALVRQRLHAAGPRFIAVHDSFVRIPFHLRRLGLAADAMLIDLGFSSAQMDAPERGFSFSQAGPLDMRFDRRSPVTAADLVASMSEPDLRNLIARYGEDPLAAKIARKLVQRRQIKPILTTVELADVVLDAYGPRARSSRLHPATRTFMALRIAVNDELSALGALLDQIVEAAEQQAASDWLSSGARIAIISFHSLEDRMVKHRFKDLVQRGLADWLTPGHRPLRASPEEQDANPRSRSAKLRGVRLGAVRTSGTGGSGTPARFMGSERGRDAGAMTKENKLALVVGFALILLVGILVSDHFSAARTQQSADLLPAEDPLVHDQRRDPDLLRFSPPRPRFPAQATGRLASREEPIADRLESASSEMATLRMPDLQSAPLPTPNRGPGQLAAPAMQFHEVRSGESLTTICEQHYGQASMVASLAAFNDLPDPDLVQVGIRLRLPPLAELTSRGGGSRAAESAPTSPQTSAGRSATYTVQEGDVLSLIAQRRLGSARRWRELFELNRAVIADPDHVEVGVVLMLPSG